MNFFPVRVLGIGRLHLRFDFDFVDMHLIICELVAVTATEV